VLKSGDEKDVEVSFPADYHAEELAGKRCFLKLRCMKSSAKNCRSWMMHLLLKFLIFATLAELKEDLRISLKSRKKRGLSLNWRAGYGSCGREM
jgi:trigger factor